MALQRDASFARASALDALRGVLRRRRAAAAGVRLLSVCVASLAWLSASVAAACPDCSIGRIARSQVWSDDFTLHLLACVAPFALIVVASRWAERMDESTSRYEPPKE